MFGGMGSHAEGVGIAIQQLHLSKIYIIYSQQNTDEFVIKIEQIKRDIAEMNRLLGNVVSIQYIQLNEYDIYASFDALYAIYWRERHANIITDLTAGHKSISILLWYAHAYIQQHTDQQSRLVYVPFGANNFVDYPIIRCEKLLPNEEEFLRDVQLYHHDTFVRDETHIIKLSAYLTKKGYRRPSISRYRQHLRQLQYLGENDDITIHGHFYLRGNALIS